MTREDAIDLLNNLTGMVEDNHNSDYDTALKMGIKALEQSGQFIETLHDIQKMIATTEENNVCTYYNTTCCGALLSSIETVIEETLIELGENK